MRFLIRVLLVWVFALPALAEGRAYLFTNSESDNVTVLHIINSSNSSQSFTGTLYNGSGEQLGGASVALHSGQVASQGRVVLTASDLETLFSTGPWPGPAMLVVDGPADFELMTKLTSPSGLVSNTNCVREGAVHNVEGFDSDNQTFIRFINTGTSTISDITGTLRDEAGGVIGSADVVLRSALGAKQQVWLNRNTLSGLVSAEWNGVASLEITSSAPDLKLLNLNFVNGETFFNFSCFETSESGGIYLMTNSNSENVSETHIINTADEAQTFSGTIYNGSGDQIGGASSALHTGTIPPNGRLVLTADDLESATGADAWPGPARVQIGGSGSFELMTRLASPSGLVSNTNCVRRSNVHNIEGFNSDNMTFVRFINTGSSAITNITGTLYDLNGNVLGSANALLMSELAGNGAKWLNRSAIADAFGVTWNDEASLVVTADDDTNLRLLNLNFVNDETFFNFSCYERNEDSLTAREYYEANVEPVIQSRCIICHIDGGVATATPLIYAPSDVSDGVDLNYELIGAYVAEEETRAQTLLDKARGVNHGGGPQLSSDSEEFQFLSTFLDMLGAETDSSSSVGSYWEGVSLLPASQTLRRASMILNGEQPPANLFADVSGGGEAALPDAIRALMTGDSFHEFVTRGANDRLLTDALFNSAIFDAADLNVPFFAIGADYQYEFYLENGGVNAVGFDVEWSQHWYWGLARAPVEMIAYIVENNRDYREVVTGDYYMVNSQSNQFLNAGATFADDDPPNLFKPGTNNGQIVQDESLVGEFIADTGYYVDAHSGFIDYPQAGVLNTHAFLGRYPTTETNRNRARARWTYYHFLGVDIEKSAARTTDPVALADTDNPTMNNPACTVCHTTMDPVAGAFQNYGNSGLYRNSWGGLDALPDTYKYPENYDENAEPSEYAQGDTWFRDMRTPGFGSQLAPDSTNSLQWLGQEIAEDPRFATASVRFWWGIVMGAEPIEAPEVNTDFDYSQRLAAFEAQNDFIETLGEDFATGIDGGSAFNGKDLLVQLMISPWFRADRADTETVRDQMISTVGTRRLLTPEELSKKSEALFGWKWDRWNNQIDEGWFEQVFSGFDRFSSYYGGIDSAGVTERPTGLTPLMFNVAERHALAMACPGVQLDFDMSDGARTLFGGITLDSTPDSDEVGIRDKIVDLHYQFWSETHSPDDPEVTASYQIILDVRQEREELGWDYVNIWPDESCNFYLEEHWADDDSIGNRGQDPTYMKSAWSGLLIYLMTDYKFLHE